MRVLLIEDNIDQVSKLERYIHDFMGKETEIIGPYDQFADVLPHVAVDDIALALVDIQLHDDRYAGIHIAEMLQQLSDIPILFVSGVTDREILLKAESVKYSDFLKKPYDRPGFERAIERVRNNVINRRRGFVKIIFQPRFRDKYWIKTDRSEYRVVFVKDILCVEAFGHYCRFYVKGFRFPFITKASLKRDILEGGLLQHQQFFQLNRSLVINLDQVERVIGNSLIIEGLKLMGDQELKIPKDRRKDVLQALGIADH